MLKRHQILLNDWLVEYIKNCSDRYDISFSEVIRLTLCVEMGLLIYEFWGIWGGLVSI